MLPDQSILVLDRMEKLYGVDDIKAKRAARNFYERRFGAPPLPFGFILTWNGPLVNLNPRMR